MPLGHLLVFAHLEAVREGSRSPPLPSICLLPSSQVPWSIHLVFGQDPWRD